VNAQRIERAPIAPITVPRSQNRLPVAHPIREVKLEDGATLWVCDGRRVEGRRLISFWGRELKSKATTVQVLVNTLFKKASFPESQERHRQRDNPEDGYTSLLFFTLPTLIGCPALPVDASHLEVMSLLRVPFIKCRPYLRQKREAPFVQFPPLCAIDSDCAAALYS